MTKKLAAAPTKKDDSVVAIMKRPAAAPIKKDDDVVKITQDKFSLGRFIAKCMKTLNVGIGRRTTLTLATACSGSGAPSIVLRSILKDPNAVNEIWASE